MSKRTIGRPKKIQGAREHTLGIRLTSNELREITAAAQGDALPDSVWARAVLLRVARSVLR